MKSQSLQLIIACCCVIFITACLKDTAYRTYTYEVATPVYNTTDQVRNNIKTAAPKPVTGLGKMYVLGDYIFLNDPGRGIHIINNTNPSSPVNESYINIPGCEDMAVLGNTLYADCFTDLMTIDISNPKEVKLKKFIPNMFPDRQYVLGYRVDSGSVIVNWIVRDTTVRERMEIGGWRGGMVFMDAALTNSYSASSAGKANGGKGGSMARFAIQSDMLYAVTFSKLQVIDLAVTQSPQWKKSIDLGWGIETIYPFKDKLFIGARTGMHIYSVANPSNPEKAGTFQHAQVCDPVIADDNYAYVTLRSGTTCNGFTNQLDVVNVSDINHPSLLKSYNLTNPHGLSKDGRWLFICDGRDGLKVFDANDPKAIQLKQTLKISDTYDVICLNGLAIVSAADGLYQYDYTNINKITLLSKTGIAH